MDIKVIGDDGKEVTSKETSVPEPVALENTQTDDIFQREIGRVLGVEGDAEFSKYQSNLKTLLDYARTQTTDHSPENLKWVIRSLETRLGTAPFGEDRVKFLTRYAYLLSEEKKIAEERKKFERL